MKAVLQYRASPGMREQLATLAPDWLQIVVVAESDRETFAAEMRDADVLLHVLEPVTAEVIAGAAKLQLIQKIGVGVNTIDLDAALARVRDEGGQTEPVHERPYGRIAECHGPEGTWFELWEPPR